MFHKGQLLRFDPFIFPDGGQPKAKYFIVLDNNGEGVLLASLPTSKDHVPSDITFNGGCLEIPERNFNVFGFMPSQPVTQTFAFTLPTFIYGSALKIYPQSEFLRQQADGETIITGLGEIEEQMFSSLLECLRNSSEVKRKYKKLL